MKMVMPKLRFRRDDGTEYPEWEGKKLEASCETIIGGGTPSTDDMEYWNGKTPWISSSDLTDNDIHHVSITRRISDAAIRNSATKKIPCGSIMIISRVGVGKVAVAPCDLCTSQDFTNIVNPKGNSLFFGYLLLRLMQHRARAVQGTSIKGIASKEIKKYLVLLPCSEEQRKIAEFLSDLDAVISASEDEVAALEQQKKGAMQKIFSQEMRFRRDDGTEYPEWKRVKVLDMLIQPITDGPHETPVLVEEGVPFASVEAIENGRVNLAKRRGYITKEYDEVCAKKYKPRMYDVYMVKSGATTGKVGIVTTSEDFNIWSPLAAMRTSSKTEALFLFFMLQSDLIQNQVWTKLSLGNQPNLGMRALEMFNAVLPCLEEQQKIADFLSSFDEAIALARQELEKWKLLKKGLMQQMFV